MRASRTLLVALTVALTAVLAALTPATASAEPAAFTNENVAWGVNEDGRLEFFWVHDSTGELMHQWELTEGGDLSAPQSLKGKLLYDQVAVGHNEDGRLEVFGVGTNKEMFHIWQFDQNCCWSAWQGMDGGFTGPPIVGVTSYEGLAVIAPGLDNLPYMKYQQNKNCCWSERWVRV